MKKGLIGLLCLLLLVGAWFYLTQEPEPVTVEVTIEPNIDVEQASQSSDSLITEADDEERINPIEKIETSDTNESDDGESTLTCMERYKAQPEWKEMEAVISAIYMSGEEAAGEGTYQQIPIEAVKSYADSGDSSAMLHYASETMWRSAFGTYLNKINRDPNEDMEKLKQKTKLHKPDLEGFFHGADYAYLAAVEGRYGGVMEITAMTRGLLHRLSRDEEAMDKSMKVLINRHAYLDLLQSIHQNDKELLTVFILESEFQKDLEVVFRGEEPEPSQLEKIQRQIKRQSQQLHQQWEADRRRRGYELYPDLLPKRLEDFFEKMEQECGN